MKMFWPLVVMIICGIMVWRAYPTQAAPRAMAEGHASAAQAGAPLPSPGRLGSEEALKLIDKLGQGLTIIDVRTEEEFNQGHIPNAKLSPLQTLQSDLARIPKNVPILLVCRTGRRAAAAYDIMRKAFPANKAVWFLDGTPEYHKDGAFTFR